MFLQQCVKQCDTIFFTHLREGGGFSVECNGAFAMVNSRAEKESTWKFQFSIFFWATPHGMWDHSSLTRNGTQAPSTGSMEF